MLPKIPASLGLGFPACEWKEPDPSLVRFVARTQGNMGYKCTVSTLHLWESSEVLLGYSVLESQLSSDPGRVTLSK